MCEPVSWIGVISSVVSMGVGYMQRRATEKQAEQRAMEMARQRNSTMKAQFQTDMRNWEYNWKVAQAGYEAQAANASMQAGYNRRVYQRDLEKYHQQMAYAGMMRKNAKEAYDADMELHGAQTDQMNTKVDLDEWERKRQYQRDRGKIRVASGESGLTGVSVMKELSNSLLNTNYDVAIMESNRGNMNEQQDAKAKKLKTNYQGRLNQAMNPIAPPSPMGGASVARPLQAPKPVMGNLVSSGYQAASPWAMYGPLAMGTMNIGENFYDGSQATNPTTTSPIYIDPRGRY